MRSILFRMKLGKMNLNLNKKNRLFLHLEEEEKGPETKVVSGLILKIGN